MPTEIQPKNAFYKAIVDQIHTVDRLDASINRIEIAVGQVSGKVDGIATTIGRLPFPTSIKIELDPHIQGSLNQTVNLLGRIYEFLQDQAGEPIGFSDDHIKLYDRLNQVRVTVLDRTITILNEINEHLRARSIENLSDECRAILGGHPDLLDRFNKVFRPFEDNPPRFQEDRARRVSEVRGLERDLARRLDSPPHAASGK
jgi:hypothetical protein